MASRAELVVALKAVNEATKVLKEVQGDIKGMGDVAKGTTGPLGKLGGALGDVSKIAGGFVLANGIMQAPGFLLDAAKAAAEDEAATARLEQALRNAGGAYDENLAAVNARIAAGQELAFSDDQIRDSFQQLLAATGDVNESLDRQKVAMDLARGANIDLETASRMVSKVNEENVDAFRRMGIVIKDGATEAEALAAVQAKFAGQSDAYAQSTAGQMAQASIAMGEFKETIGAVVLPILTELVLFANEKVIPAISAFAEEAGPKIQEFATAVGKYWREDIKPALDNLQAAWESIDQVVIPILQDLAADVQFMAETIALALGIVVDILGGDFSGAWDKVKQLVDGVVDAMERKITLFKDALKGLAPLVKEGALAIGGAIKDGIVEGLEAAGGLVADVHNALAALLEGAVNYVIDQVNDAVSFTITNPFGPDVTVNPPDIPRVSLPRMAQGGVVVAGDNPSGIEAIVPLERAHEFGFGGGGHVTITINALDARSVEEWLTREGASLIRTALEREVRFAP